MVMLHRRDPRSPLTKRLLVMLGIIASLFLVRGAAWWTGSVWLDRLSMVPAALVPLGALIVTEGILRRHAQRIAKIVAVAGGSGLGLAGMLRHGTVLEPTTCCWPCSSWPVLPPADGCSGLGIAVR